MSDLISRQAVNTLVDELARAISDERYFLSRGRSTGEIMSDILNLPSVENKGEWIPCSERLPEQFKEVIVTDIETSDTYLSRYVGNGYWECDNGLFKNRIIAWQPKPKPYKEEKRR